MVVVIGAISSYAERRSARPGRRWSLPASDGEMPISRAPARLIAVAYMLPIQR